MIIALQQSNGVLYALRAEMLQAGEVGDEVRVRVWKAPRVIMSPVEPETKRVSSNLTAS
jgi:hypothetical protein